MAYTCPYCGRTSQHPDDERNRYCGACHQFDMDGYAVLSQGTVQELVNQFARGEYRIIPTADETPERPPASGSDPQP